MGSKHKPYDKGRANIFPPAPITTKPSAEGLLQACWYLWGQDKVSTALCLNWLLKIKFVSEFEALFSVEEKQCGVLTSNCDLL